MVCVDRENYKCCCGCDLTVATGVFGILFIIGGLGSVGSSGGLGLMGVFQFIMGIVMCCVLCQQKSIPLRRCIYYTYIVYCILLVISLILVIVLIMALDWSELSDDEYRSEWEEDNENAIRGVLIAVVIIWAAIYIPVTLVGLEVVYYGWREQEKKEDKKEKKKKEKKERKENEQAMAA